MSYLNRINVSGQRHPHNGQYGNGFTSILSHRLKHLEPKFANGKRLLSDELDTTFLSDMKQKITSYFNRKANFVSHFLAYIDYRSADNKMTKATLFRTIATLGFLGTFLYKLSTNTSSIYLSATQVILLVILWIALAVDRYKNTHSKSYLKWDLFLVGVSALLLIAIIALFR